MDLPAYHALSLLLLPILRGDGNGNVVAVSGAATDRVQVNGYSTPCGGARSVRDCQRWHHPPGAPVRPVPAYDSAGQPSPLLRHQREDRGTI